MQGSNIAVNTRETRRNGSQIGAQSKHKMVNKQSQLEIDSNMMSQEQIQNYVEEAEKETQQERKKLEQQDNQRKVYVKKVLMSKPTGDSDDEGVMVAANGKALKNNSLQNEKLNGKKLFGKFVDGTSKKDRLQDLLDKTAEYTNFVLQQNIKSHKAQQRQKYAEHLMNGNGAQNSNLKDSKTNLSKRRNKKGAKESSDGSDDENETMLTRLTEQPSTLVGGGKLRDYQLDGLNWMISLYETGINGILADEMGLGKTIQTISLLSFLREFKQIKGFHLIIMPKSVVGNWMSEFNKWAPQIRVCNLIAKKESREDIIKNVIAPGKFDVCITTFEGVRICMSALQKFSWQYIIIDEAHKIKNEDSQTSKRIRQLNSKNRLLLTGTPLQNNLHELWSLLNFLLPEIFSSSADFDEWFDLGKNDELTNEEQEQKNSEAIKQLHKILRPFMLRRIKREVEKSLLPKIEMHINVGITEMQKSIYRQLLKKSTIDKGTSTSHYKNILVQLRKVCDHPYLFHGIEPTDAPELGDHLVKSCGKMQFLDKLLHKSKADNSQTLIFSGFTSMLDILEDYCRFREYKYCRLDGNTELEDRQTQIDDFTSANTDKFIFLISTRAGGLGLNLMTANTVVLYDSDWNPQMDLQAMDRAHRIGQKKQVRVYRLITKNTMEEKMVEKQTMKLKLDSLIIQKGRMAPKNTGMQKDDLKDMVNYGADAIFEIGSNIDEEDIDEMIANGEAQAKKINEVADESMKDKFNMINFEMNSCNLYQFEDIDYLKEKRKDAEAALQKNVIAMLETETAENGGRRKVKKSMAESSICPNIFANGNVGVSGEAKKKRLAKVTDFRFFPDPDRLRELILIEMESKYSGYIKGMESQMFTPEMQIEKDLIESKGFLEWDRREFQKFIQALELYATDDYANISKHMQASKSPEEVAQYAQVFFSKVHTLQDHEKIVQKVQRAQKNVNFNMRAPYVIRKKIEQYSNPYEEIVLSHATQKSKFFTKETDIILLCLADKYGYGNWVDIKRALRREQRCRFEHIFISRSEEELKKRIIYLVQSLEKENDEGQKVEKPTIGNPVQVKVPQNIDFLDIEIDNLMQKAEESAANALSKLNLGGFCTLSENEGMIENIKIPSQETVTVEQNSPVNSPTKVNENNMLQEIDDEDMKGSADSGEFDNQVNTQEREKEQVAKAKEQKKTQKKNVKKQSQRSNESGIREGDEDNGDAYMNDDDEMDAILQRELEGVEVENLENSIEQSTKKVNEQSSYGNQRPTNGNTSADTSNLQTDQRPSSSSKNSRQLQNKNAKQQVLNSNNSRAKQQSLNDWMSSATKTSASKPLVNGTQIQNLVGQKRTDTDRLDKEKQIVLPVKKQKEFDGQIDVSEFNTKGEM